MQLADSALLQVLLSASNISALREILNNLLSRPTTRKQLCLRLGETPFDVGNKAVVGRGCAELVGVLEVYGLIGTTCWTTLLEKDRLKSITVRITK